MDRLHAQVVLPELSHFEAPNQPDCANPSLSQAALGMLLAERTSWNGG